MLSFKHIRRCNDSEAVTLTRERPRLFFSVPEAYESRSVDVYKACALAALEGLSESAGCHFPKKHYGDPGWDAHHVTKRIFEEQTIFDPYADKTFCDEALRLCQYYTLRYTQPDALEKATDFTLEQFADCFTTNGVLILRKRGCDFWPDDAKTVASNLQNYRLYLQYCNREGRYIVGDISMAKRTQDKRAKDVSALYGLSTHFQREEESGTFGYNVPGYAHLAYDYTQADVLRLINSDSIVQYDRIEITD